MKFIITGDDIRQAPVLKKGNDFYMGTIYTKLYEASDLTSEEEARLRASLIGSQYRLEAIN